MTLQDVIDFVRRKTANGETIDNREFQEIIEKLSAATQQEISDAAPVLTDGVAFVSVNPAGGPAVVNADRGYIAAFLGSPLAPGAVTTFTFVNPKMGDTGFQYCFVNVAWHQLGYAANGHPVVECEDIGTVTGQGDIAIINVDAVNSIPAGALVLIQFQVD